MADPQTPHFTLAHKVVLDCMAFVSAERIHHPNRRLVLDALAEALPHAHGTGNRWLDRVIMSGSEVTAADRAMLAQDAGASLRWMAAMIAADAALAEFFFWRGASSIEAFRERLAQGENHAA
jgi:hypothetical protein